MHIMHGAKIKFEGKTYVVPSTLILTMKEVSLTLSIWKFPNKVIQEVLLNV